MATTNTSLPQPLQPIPQDPIGEVHSWRDWLNKLAQNGSIITQTVTNNVLTVNSLGNLFIGPNNTLSGTPYYVNTQQLADAAVTAAKLGQQAVNTANINYGAIVQSLIASGAVGYQQFATNLTPVTIVTSLPVLPNKIGRAHV